MALNTSKCNHLTPLPFKGLTPEQPGDKTAGPYIPHSVMERELGNCGDAWYSFRPN